MLKKFILLFLVIFAGCSNPPAPRENVRNVAHKKSKAPVSKPAVNPWTIDSFKPKEGETEGRKYVRFVTEGSFSDTAKISSYLYAEILVDKTHAGIFLHKLKKSNPAEKFNEPVQIKMSNSSGQEIQMTSTRRWNSAGGILIERNNNDYSQFRIFMLQSTGVVTAEIRDSAGNIFYFSINADGFSDSFSTL